jgi:hypothetical protein
MAHFTSVRVAAKWIVAPVTQAEFQAFDDAQYKSVNGDAGGSWTAAAATSFGGAGWAIRGQATLSALASLTTELGGMLTFGTGSTFTSAATVTLGAGRIVAWLGATTWASGSTLTFAGGSFFTTATANAWTWNGTITGAAAVQGSAQWTFQSGAAVTQSAGSTLAIAAGTYVGDVGSTTTLNATVTNQATDFRQSGGITLSGSAAQTDWRVTAGTDANGNYGATADVWIVPNITANRTYTVQHTAGTIPVEGTRTRFHCYNTAAHSLTLQRENTEVIFQNGATTSPFYVDLEFRDGQWHCAEFGCAPIGSSPAGG